MSAKLVNSIKTLALMFIDPSHKYTADDIISYIRQEKIHPDTMIPLRKGVLVPIIYLACKSEKYLKTFKYLIGKKAQVNKPMIIDKTLLNNDEQDQVIELLYFSHPIYIPTLVKYGATVDSSKVITNTIKLIIGGNLPKIKALIQVDIINSEIIKSIIDSQPMIGFTVINALYGYMFIGCQQSMSDEWFNRLLTNYLTIIKLLLNNGLSLNTMEDEQTLFQHILNTYIPSLIKLSLTYRPDINLVKLYHYSNFEQSNRLVMSRFYNEDNYREIKSLLDQYF